MTKIMGVLNVTEDSFSDGGAWLDRDAAIEHGLAMAAAGADIVDVGGESTRPGASRVSEPVEISRVVPVVQALTAHGVRVSIDTMRSSTARAAIDAGAFMVNDVSGGLADEAMPALVAEAGVKYVVMHWRGHSDTMQQLASYGDVVAEVAEQLSRRVDAITIAGVKADQIIIDPGIGFAKTHAHNWALLHDLKFLQSLGFPVLVGASRKSFLGALLASDDGVMRDLSGRDAATLAITALAAAAGVWGVRVHDVGANVDAVKVVSAMSGRDSSA